KRRAMAEPMLPVPPRITRTLETASGNPLLHPLPDVAAQRFDREALAELGRRDVGAEGAHQVLVGDAESECLLDSKSQVQQVDALGTEVLQNASLEGHLLGTQREHFDENV